MAKMKNLIMDMEEQFYNAAQDVVHEYQYPHTTCQGADSFVTMMMQQRDMIVHQSESEIHETLLEIYYG